MRRVLNSICLVVVVACLCAPSAGHGAGWGRSGPAKQADKQPALPTVKPANADESYRMRDPFWPVGYWPVTQTKIEPVDTQQQATTKPAVTNPKDQADWAHAEKQLNVTSVAQGPDGKHFAIINGAVVAIGEMIDIKFGEYRYRWKVMDISRKGGIKLDRVSARVR